MAQLAGRRRMLVVTVLALGTLLTMGARVPISGAMQPGAQDSALPDPADPGPYAVGVTQRTFVRVSTTTGEPRELDTVIWYPAEASAGNLPADPDLAASLDAPALASSDPLPVVLWSHGNPDGPAVATFLMTHLASYGFVVVAPPHPGDTAATCPQPCTTENPAFRDAVADSVENRPDDIRFALDQVLLLSAGDDPILGGLLDPARVGMTGKSLGGSTALRVMAQDERIRAAVAMGMGAGPPTLAAARQLTGPVMLMGSGLDDQNPFAQQQAVFDALPEGGESHWLLGLPTAGHGAYSDTCPVGWAGCSTDDLPQVAAHTFITRWATAFLLCYVAGDERYATYLEPERVQGDPRLMVSRRP